MKITNTLLVAALAAAGLAATAAEARNQSSHGSGGMHSGFARGGGMHAGSRNWSGRQGGHWNGRAVHSGGRHWSGGRSLRHWGPRFGAYIGAPALFGSYYWGSPWWDGYYYPRSTVVYDDRIMDTYPMSVPESYNEVEVSPTGIAPDGEGAPTQAPAYRNYCESARAYYPRVAQCPEGWRFEPTR